ncbi:MAG: FHA domain-containing protein [Acidobacteriota bacterium]|nr:FHA domain-containing protein [Acidobacteriota bacterium]
MPQQAYQVSRETTASLYWLTGNLAGHKTVLDKNYTIGRDPANCHVLLEDDLVSRQHAAFELDSRGNATIVDLRSSNGTFVNGEAVTRHELKDGDRIGFGSDEDTTCSYQAAFSLSSQLPDGDAATVPNTEKPTALITGALTQCPNCNRLITSSLNFCRHCAHQLAAPPEEIHETAMADSEAHACHSCGTPASMGAAFCRQCGATMVKLPH